MFWSNFQRATIDSFGGLVTLMDRMDLPVGVSPNCQNVEFFPGGVKSRFGTSVVATCATVGNLNCTGLYNYIDISLSKKQLAYFYDYGAAVTTNGILQSLAGGSLSAIADTISSPYIFSTSAFGRAWISFSDGTKGTAWPMKWDGTSLTQIGLPAPQTAGGYGATEVFNSGTTDTAGSNHMVRVTFEDATGASSPPSVATAKFSTTGTANKGIQVSSIPLGPAGTVRRVLWMCTESDGSVVDINGVASTTNYYTLRNSSMVIGDNSTTTQTFAVTDATLTTGESILAHSATGANLFQILEQVPPCLGNILYKGRTFYYNFLGSTSQTYISASGRVKGYGLKGNNGSATPWSGSGALATMSTPAGAAGQSFTLTADGATASINFQSPVLGGNFEPVPQFTPGVTYGVRARVRRGATPFTSGGFTIKSTVGATTTYTTPLSGITQAWQNVETGVLITGQSSSAPGPSPLYVGIDNAVVGTPAPNGAVLYVDWIDFYPIGFGRDGSKVFASRVFAPTTVEQVNGAMYVQKDNGQDIKAAFVLRDSLYFVKERSIYVTNDNGVTEPAGWSIQQVDDSIGCPGPNAVAVAEGIALIASRSGLYLFNGAVGDKLSQEIVPTWQRINWQYAYTMSVVFDTENKRVYVSAPLDAATSPSHLLVLNYEEGYGDPLASGGSGRKWTIWTIAAASMLMAEQSNGKKLLYFGGNDNSRQIYKYDTSTVNDNGGAINSYYETAPIGNEYPTLFGGVLAWVSGGGTATASYTRPDNTNTTIQTFTPTTPASRNWQFGQNLWGYEKIGYRLGTNGVGAYWSTNKIVPFFMASPYLSPARGVNP